jgi:hypothetical protein
MPASLLWLRGRIVAPAPLAVACALRAFLPLPPFVASCRALAPAPWRRGRAEPCGLSLFFAAPSRLARGTTKQNAAHGNAPTRNSTCTGWNTSKLTTDAEKQAIVVDASSYYGD